MDGQNERILLLLTRLQNGEATEQELTELDEWWDSFENNPTFTSQLSPDEQIRSREQLLHKINSRISSELPASDPYILKKQAPLWQKISVAAILIICFSAGAYFLFNYPEPGVRVAKDIPADISPGGNKAVLTLANGRKISLTDAQNGELAEQAGIKITKAANGVLTYTVSDKHGVGETSGQNTIETPRGGKYLVQLPDGSHVWLNAASSMKFPSSFNSLNERRVELRGEAYFEIARDKTRPFLVSTPKQLVTVLGTHFNVNAYQDEPAIRTTLLEGSVNIKSGQINTIIKPGQQAVLAEGRLNTIAVDTEEVIAWQNGMFQFSEEGLESIMRKVSRWYDVDIQFEDEKVKSLPLTGIITQFSNVSKILRMLELTGQVHFKVEGRKIIVRSNKNQQNTN